MLRYYGKGSDYDLFVDSVLNEIEEGNDSLDEFLNTSHCEFLFNKGFILISDNKDEIAKYTARKIVRIWQRKEATGVTSIGMKKSHQ